MKKITYISRTTLLSLLLVLLTRAIASYDVKYDVLDKENQEKPVPSRFIDDISDLKCDQSLEDEIKLERLATSKQHIDALENAFKIAKRSILVTNYGRLYPSILETDIFTTLIPEARARNVSIYIRYNHDDRENHYKPIPENVQDYFNKYGVDFARLPTHAKIVAVDHQFIMMGSYNWLTDLTSSYEPQTINHSFVYRGKEIYGLTEHIWDVIKYYRNKEFGEKKRPNYRKAYSFKRDPLNQEFFVSNLTSKLTYIALIEKHRSQLLDIFEKAQQRLVILSPFVARNGTDTYQRDFVRKLLTRVLQKNVAICFVCLPDHEQRFQEYLGPLFIEYPHLKVIPYPNLHAKTLIQDNTLIAEGSFNWLCAARDEVSQSHKHEATLMYEGPLAQTFIQDFYKTELGKLIVNTLHSVPQLLKRPREEDSNLSLDLLRKKRLRSSSADLTEREFFTLRKDEVEKDLWINYPFWVKYSNSYMYLVYEKYFDILSGASFGKKGYCARINKQYLMDHSEIAYFPTIHQTKEELYLQWQNLRNN